jgi:hypothetical protein
MKKEFFPPRPPVNPTIYAYELVGVATHKAGLIDSEKMVYFA